MKAFLSGAGRHHFAQTSKINSFLNVSVDSVFLPLSPPAPPFLSLLPFLSPSFFHSGKITSMIIIALFLMWEGEPLSQVQRVLHTVLFLKLTARASHLGQMECLSRKVPLGAGKEPQSARSRSPSELMAGTRDSAPSYSVFVGVSPCFTDYMSASCVFLEKCPSKQLSFLEEGRSGDLRAWDFPGRAFLTIGHSGTVPSAFQGPLKMSEPLKIICWLQNRRTTKLD